jgi:hypothetical protein
MVAHHERHAIERNRRRRHPHTPVAVHQGHVQCEPVDRARRRPRVVEATHELLPQPRERWKVDVRDRDRCVSTVGERARPRERARQRWVLGGDLTHHVGDQLRVLDISGPAEVQEVPAHHGPSPSPARGSGSRSRSGRPTNRRSEHSCSRARTRRMLAKHRRCGAEPLVRIRKAYLALRERCALARLRERVRPPPGSSLGLRRPSVLDPNGDRPE